MPKKIQLSIPKPCHEDWNAMTQVEKGKFCGSCQKQVVDFSSMSDRQVAQFFKKPSTGSVCGRFMTDQLDRDIEIPKKRIPWVKYFFSIALPAFLVSIKSSASKTQGQIKVRKAAADTSRRPMYADVKMMGMVARPQSIKPFMGDTVVAPVHKPVVEDIVPVCTKPVMGKPSFGETIKGEIAPVISNNKRIVSGFVLNENGEPISGASVLIKGTKIGVVANQNGVIHISAKEGNILVASSIDHEPVEIVIGKEDPMRIYMRRIDPISFSVGIIIINIKKPNKNPVDIPLFTPVRKDTPFNSFKAFPNPVPSGSGITIEWKQIEEGYYSLQLINVSGQSVHQKELWIDAEARLLHIDLPAVAAGSYFLCLTNKKTGKRLSEKIIVQ